MENLESMSSTPAATEAEVAMLPVNLTVNARTALQIYREEEDMRETVSGFNELPAEFTLPYRIYSTEEILKASLEIVEQNGAGMSVVNGSEYANKIASEHQISMQPAIKSYRDRFAVSTLHTCVDYLSLLISYIPLHVRSQFIRTVEINYDALVRVLTLYGHDLAVLEQIKQLAEAKTPARFISTSMLSDLEQVFIQLEKEHRQLVKSAGIKVELLRRAPAEKTNVVRKGVEAHSNLSLSPSIPQNSSLPSILHLQEMFNGTLNYYNIEECSVKVNNVSDPHAGVINKKSKLEVINSNTHTVSGNEHLLESNNSNNNNNNSSGGNGNNDKENNHSSNICSSSSSSSSNSSNKSNIHSIKNNFHGNTCDNIINDTDNVCMNNVDSTEVPNGVIANRNASVESNDTTHAAHSHSPSKEMWAFASNRARSPRHAQSSKTENVQEPITNSPHHRISPAHVARLTSPESQTCVTDSTIRKRSRSKEQQQQQQQQHNNQHLLTLSSSPFPEQDNVLSPHYECAAYDGISPSTCDVNCNGTESARMTELPRLMECVQSLPSAQAGSRECRKQRRKGVRTAAAAASLYAWNRPRTLSAAEKKVVLALQQLVQLLAHVYATKYNNLTPIFEYMLAACEVINGMIEKEQAHFASKEKQKPPEPFHEISLDALVETIQSSYQTFRTDEECRYEFDEDLIHPIAHALLTVMNVIEGYETKPQQTPSEEEQAKKMAKRAAAKAKRDEAARKAVEKAQLREELASRKEHERQTLRQRLQLDVPDLQSLEDDLALTHSSQCGYVQYDHVAPTNSSREFEQILFIWSMITSMPRTLCLSRMSLPLFVKSLLLNDQDVNGLMEEIVTCVLELAIEHVRHLSSPSLSSLTSRLRVRTRGKSWFDALIEFVNVMSGYKRKRQEKLMQERKRAEEARALHAKRNEEEKEIKHGVTHRKDDDSSSDTEESDLESSSLYSSDSSVSSVSSSSTVSESGSDSFAEDNNNRKDKNTDRNNNNKKSNKNLLKEEATSSIEPNIAKTEEVRGGNFTNAALQSNNVHLHKSEEMCQESENEDNINNSKSNTDKDDNSNNNNINKNREENGKEEEEADEDEEEEQDEEKDEEGTTVNLFEQSLIVTLENIADLRTMATWGNVEVADRLNLLQFCVQEVLNSEKVHAEGEQAMQANEDAKNIRDRELKEIRDEAEREIKQLFRLYEVKTAKTRYSCENKKDKTHHTKNEKTADVNNNNINENELDSDNKDDEKEQKEEEIDADKDEDSIAFGNIAPSSAFEAEKQKLIERTEKRRKEVMFRFYKKFDVDDTAMIIEPLGMDRYKRLYWRFPFDRNIYVQATCNTICTFEVNEQEPSKVDQKNYNGANTSNGTNSTYRLHHREWFDINANHSLTHTSSKGLLLDDDDDDNNVGNNDKSTDKDDKSILQEAGENIKIESIVRSDGVLQEQFVWGIIRIDQLETFINSLETHGKREAQLRLVLTNIMPYLQELPVCHTAMYTRARAHMMGYVNKLKPWS